MPTFSLAGRGIRVHGTSLTLHLGADRQLTGPRGYRCKSPVFGMLSQGGVRLAPGSNAALSRYGRNAMAQTATSSGPQSGAVFETRTQEEADLIATMQAQSRSGQEIQATPDGLRRNAVGVNAV